jgi:adenylosuccinate lyase
MREHLAAHGGIAFSQGVLLALVEAGLARDDAYRVVQRAAADAWDGGASFRERIEADPDVGARLDAAALDELFDPSRYLRNLGGVFDRLEKLPVDEGTAGR